MKALLKKIPERTKVIAGIIVGMSLFLGIVFYCKDTNGFPLLHRDFSSIMKKGRLLVITEKSSLGFELKNGKASGFQYDLAKAFADSMGLELEIIPENDFGISTKKLLENQCDLLAMNVPQTTEIKNQLALTIPVFNTHQVLVQRIEPDSMNIPLIRNHHQLIGDSICIPEDSPFKMRLENLSDEIADTIRIVEMADKSTEDLVKMVADGKIRFTICDELQAKRLKRKFPNIDIALPVGFNQQYSWAVHPESKELLLKLNEFMHYFLNSSDFWEIYRKYY